MQVNGQPSVETSPGINSRLGMNRLVGVVFAGSVLLVSCSSPEDTYMQAEQATTLQQNNDSLPESIDTIPTTTYVRTTFESTTSTLPQRRSDIIAEPKTSEALPKKPINVAVFGDSIVYGYHLDGLRWTDLLQNDLTSQPDYKHVTIQNFAVPGQSIVADIPVYYDNEGTKLGGRLVDLVREVYPENTERSNMPDVVVLVPSINEIVASKQPTIQGKAEQATAGLLDAVTYLKKLGVEHVKVTQMLSPTARWSNTCSFDVALAVDIFNSGLIQQVQDVAPFSLENNGLTIDPAENGSDEAFFKDADIKNMPNDGLHPDEQGQLVLKQQIEAELLDIIDTYNK